jgi:asparagine synthase (glutamine-hydrolysing)
MVNAAQRLPSAETNMSLDFRLKQLLRGISAPAPLRHQVWIGAFVPSELQRLLHPDLLPRIRDEVVYRQVLEDARRAEAAGIGSDSIDAALRFYLDRYLVDDILVKADRASMAASLELRAPFLDTHVVEFAARLPSSQKLGFWRTKLVLKRALRGVVPEEILRRPKKGFGIPVARWIRGPLRALFEELFSAQSLASSGVFQPAVGQRLLQAHLRGQADLRKPLWTMAIFLLWQRQWGRSAVSVSQASAA